MQAWWIKDKSLVQLDVKASWPDSKDFQELTTMPKLLWVSPLSIHDTSSASAMQMRNMLLSLKARNVDVLVLSALNFVQDSGTSMFTDLDEKLKGQDTSFNLNDNGINCIYIRTKSRRLGDMVSAEQRNFYGKMCAIINAFRPDVVMGSGTDMLSMVCFDEAKLRGLPTAYVLLDNTPRRFYFPNIDLVVTDSNAISRLYATTHKINATVVGSFLGVDGPLTNPNTDRSCLEHMELRKNIVMLNPSLNHGLSIFMRLVQMCAHEIGDCKFTVVEAEPGQFANNVKLIHEKGSDKPAFDQEVMNLVEVLPHETIIADILKQSKIMVFPSLTFESIVRVAREAVSYGVPVLGTNLTGIAESIGEAGLLVEPPQYCLNDFACAPTKTDMANFVKALKLMLGESFTERCTKVAKTYDINYSANRLFQALKPLFEQNAGNNPQLLRSGSII